MFIQWVVMLMYGSIHISVLALIRLTVDLLQIDSQPVIMRKWNKSQVFRRMCVVYCIYMYFFILYFHIPTAKHRIKTLKWLYAQTKCATFRLPHKPKLELDKRRETFWLREKKMANIKPCGVRLLNWNAGCECTVIFIVVRMRMVFDQCWGILCD